MATHDITTIVYFAAESHVDRYIDKPDEFIHTNIAGTHCLLKVAASLWLGESGVEHRFHHVFTDEVYGDL